MLLTRTVDTSHAAIKETPQNDAPPAPDSLTARLWSEHTDLAEMSLRSAYVQGVAQGDLNPDAYCDYTIEDLAYSYHGLGDCEAALARAKAMGDADLTPFLEARRARLIHSAVKRKTAIHIDDPKAVVPGAAARAYIEFEAEVARELPPIYYVLAAVPCLRLWAWMTSLLMPDATDGNIYRDWITKNNDWPGAFQLENTVNDWFAKNPEAWDWATGARVYRGCMLGELNFFRGSCGQPLIDPAGEVL